MQKRNSHSLAIGYVLWIFGFMGAHRFYYGRTATGILWLATFGLLGVGWLIDLFLIPSMDRAADLRYLEGPLDYNVGWVLLTFLGLFGFHRFYMGKWITGVIWLLTGGLLTLGYAYDFCTLNEQLTDVNRKKLGQAALT